MKAQILQVEAQFEHLRDESDEDRNIQVLVSVFFASSEPIDELMAELEYYKGQVEYEIDRDLERRAEFGGELHYILHVVAFSSSGHSPGYNSAVNELLGQELFDVLQSGWRMELVDRMVITHPNDYEAREAAIRKIKECRLSYQPSPAVGTRVIDRLLSPTSVTHG